MFKFNDKNTRTRGQIYSKLTIKTSERTQWRFSIVKFQHGLKWEVCTPVSIFRKGQATNFMASSLDPIY